ncbi:hypothetical protein tinsulaeT_20920 [Thalassotalea insulae]|uniref:Uncharacterized protein n=1 Tax=Thalassotalea insulae TaxID=2056778 RepID=A0ABQ6GVU2_9GAMM|nr:hypothetical protein [Thalassotalea insulae]GLX78752.1 hypothetical protein tinsulaeT_20920 [Thalassotalea insulae]
MKTLLTALIFFFVNTQVVAGDGSGLITRIYVHDGAGTKAPVVMFNVETHTGQPECSSHEWAFELETEVGKAMYALLLSAASQNKPVVVKGANHCNAWGDREHPYWISLAFN